MKEVILLLYSQKPLGTHKEDLEYSLTHCYKPLLTYLYSRDEIKFSLYFSIAIFEWLEDTYPEINMLIHDMVKRKQLEIIAGGYYDPIFTLLSSKDRSQQLEMSVTYLRKRFGKRPKTAWITDQVWSTSLISTLHGCGIHSVLINSGSRGVTPFTVQDLGKMVHIFPLQSAHGGDFLQKLLMPDFEGDVSSISINLDQMISEQLLNEQLLLIGKFTELFQEFTRDLRLNHSSAYVEGNPEMPLDHLPSGCYRNSRLPAGVEDYQGFIYRYPEMKMLYGKLCYSQKLSSTIKREKSLKKIVQNEILKSESYGAFSYDEWGGIYHNYLRKENYRHLIEAEKSARERGIFSSSLAPYDFDFDRMDEYIYRGKNITAVIDQKGGTLSEFDYLVTSWNYLDTFLGFSDESVETAYAPGVKRGKQNSFADVILPDSYDLFSYAKGDPSVTPLDEVPYRLDKVDRVNRKITFSHSADLPGTGRVEITKEYNLKSNTIAISYRLRNSGARKLSFSFGSELNLSFSHDGDEFLQFSTENSHHDKKLAEGKVVMQNVKKVSAKDFANKTLISLNSAKRFSLYKNGYYTLINTLFGEEDIYQYSILLPLWKVSLEPDQTWENSLEFHVEKIK